MRTFALLALLASCTGEPKNDDTADHTGGEDTADSDSPDSPDSSGDSTDSGDSAESDDTADTADTAETGDSGDTGDTGDSGPLDPEDLCPSLVAGTWTREAFSSWTEQWDPPDLVVADDHTVWIVHNRVLPDAAVSTRDPSGGWETTDLEDVSGLNAIEPDGEGGVYVLADYPGLGVRARQGRPGAWTPLDTLGLSGAPSQAVGAGPDGRLFALVTPDYDTLLRATWDGSAWSTTPLGTTPDYVEGVTLDVDGAGGVWSTWWADVGGRWGILREDPTGAQSEVYRLPGNTLNWQKLDQAVTDVEGRPTPFLMVNDQNPFPPAGVSGIVGDGPLETIVSVDTSGYGRLPSGGEEGDHATETYASVYPVGVVAHRGTVVWLWSTQAWTADWVFECDSRGCFWTRLSLAVTATLDGACQFEDGPRATFTLSVDGAPYVGRATFGPEGLLVATYELGPDGGAGAAALYHPW